MKGQRFGQTQYIFPIVPIISHLCFEANYSGNAGNCDSAAESRKFAEGVSAYLAEHCADGVAKIFAEMKLTKNNWLEALMFMDEPARGSGLGRFLQFRRFTVFTLIIPHPTKGVKK
jgi:hypothetical protein